MIEILSRSSAVLAAGLLLHACLARSAARLRHGVLAAAIFGAAAVTPLSLTLPAWEVALPAAFERTPAADRPAAARDAKEPTVVSAVISTATPDTARTLPIVPIAWILGVVITGSGLAGGLWRLRRMSAASAEITGGRWRDIADAVAAAYGIRCRIRILQTGQPHVLATYGVSPARLLLPSHAQEWGDDRIHAVLCHELAHVRRRDWIMQIAADSIRAALWFNPLIWIACRRLRRESEQACDDAVLDRGVPAREYAEHILALARQCRRPAWTWMPALQMAHRSTLERRITAMLNPHLTRRVSRRTAGLTALLLAGIVAATAAVRAAQAPTALNGTIYDPTGAVIPGVAVTLQDPQGGRAQATTDASGRFAFPGVGSGSYTLLAQLPGFKSLNQQFNLRVASDWDRAVTLQVGDLSEQITVTERRVPAIAASAPAGPKPVRVGGNIRVPRKVTDVRPVYPASMRDAGREGDVPIDARIGRDGSVVAVRVLSSQVHPEFAIAAVDAVRQWKFTPTLLNGSPIEVVMTVTVRFSLGD